MSTSSVVNLLRIAASLEATNPVLAYELERSALAVINPGAKSFEKNLGDLVEVLKGLKQELEAADKKLDLDDAAEFAKFFDNEAEAEAEELRQMLKVGSFLLHMADESTGGIMDKVKGLFKKKDKKPETEEKPAGYQMSEREMDEFVEGDRDWVEGSQKVEQESKENKEFFEDAKAVQTLLDRVRDKPSRSMVRTIIKDLGDLIERGTKLMKGDRKVQDSLSHKDVVVDDDAKPAPKGKPAMQGLEGIVTQYTSLLNDIEGDDAKLVKTLKEFFKKVQPVLEEDRASLAAKRAKILPLLVRTASANPRVRPALLPVIKRWTGRVAAGQPQKPSDLDARSTHAKGHPRFTYFTWYMAYSDPSSQEYPIIVFVNDGREADPGDPASSLKVISFGSQEEYNTWKEGEVGDPANAEPIDPADADDMASQAQFLEASHFA